MVIYKSLASGNRYSLQRRKVIWQSVPLLSVLHPNTTKSYGPDDEKYFDKQYDLLAIGHHPLFPIHPRGSCREALSRCIVVKSLPGAEWQVRHIFGRRMRSNDVEEAGGLFRHV